MRAVLTKVMADVRRRRLQTALVALITLMAATMATTALTVLVRSSAPFDDAFKAANGAHLTFHLDAAKVTPDQLRRTASLPVVTGMTPARPMVVAPIEVGKEKSPLVLIGRDDPGGQIDRVQLVAGRWVQGPGEVVVTRYLSDGSFPRIVTGDVLHILSRPDRPSLRVVGEAINVSDSTDYNALAWVRAGEVAGFANQTDSKLGYQVGYRVRGGESDAGLDAARKQIQAALPAGSETTRYADWLSFKRGMAWMVTILSSALLAFTVFALGAAALIVANAITGAVIASRREIGIMKAIGFAPREVMLVFVGQMVVSALFGAVLGVAAGIAISSPLLQQGAQAMGLPGTSPFDGLVDAGVLFGTLVVVAVAALVPSLRAGSTNAVSALAVGNAPPTSSPRWLAFVQRLPLPRPVSVGIDDVFRRPLRGLLTVFALVIGVATVTLAFEFRTISEQALTNTAAMGKNYDIRLDRFGAFPDGTVTSTLNAQPEVAAVLAEQVLTVRLPGLTDPVRAVAARGETPAYNYLATSGRWFAGPGEVVVAPVTMKEAKLRIGDRVEADIEGHLVPFRVVGSFNDWSVFDGRGLRFDWASYAAAVPAAEPSVYKILLKPGAGAAVVGARVQATEPHFLKATSVDRATADPSVGAFQYIMAVPALLLILIAAIGVFNTMLLNSRERSFDIAVLKAIGMSGRQVIAMVIAPALLLGVFAVVVGLPAGIQLTAFLVGSMAESVGAVFEVPGLFYGGFWNLLAAIAGGLLTAVVGALLPAWWAARAPVATVLRAE